jgi:RNA polymerase sigma-70 factor (ECF subfamily)
LRLASEGNVAAFEEIYKATSSFVYNVALRISRNRADSQEITQEVFMKIYHNLKNFQFRSSFKTWVYRIAVNAAINRYRQSIREVEGKSDYKTQIETFSSGHKITEGIIQSDNKTIVSALLETLIPEHKTCLILREFEGLSYQEISSALKIPINTVRSRLKRAREALLIQAKKRQVKNEV